MRIGIDDVARAKVFDERLASLDDEVQQVVAFLRSAAAHAGENVGPPTFEVRGVGVTYWTSGKWFFRVDPKHAHVWVHLPSGDRRSLGRIGNVAEREDGIWLTIGHMTQAVRLVPEILRAHDDVADVSDRLEAR